MNLKKGIVKTEMYSELYSVFLTFLSWLTPVITGLAILVFGIIIAASPVQSTKFLGVGFIFTAVNGLLASVNSFSMRYIGVEQVAKNSVLFSAVGMLFSIMSLVFICVFIHKNYGIRLIYLPLLLIQTGGIVIDRLVAVLLTRALGAGHKNVMWVNLVILIDDFVISSVISIIIILVFWKYRESEKVIPKAYLVRTVVLLCGVLTTGITVAIYLQSIFDSASVINGETLSMLNGIVSRGVALIFPLYVFVMVIKASKNKPAETE